METLIASGIELGSAALEPKAPVARGIVEIGPYDLPEPPGGWVDLVLDDGEEEAAPRGGEAAPPGPAAAGAEADPRPGEPSLAGPFRKGRTGVASASAPKRWFLVPEALIVGGFILFGAMFLGAVVLLRTPREPGATRGSVSAPVELIDPAPGHGRRAGRGAAAAWRAGREASAAPGGEAEIAPPGVSPPPYEDEAPIGADSPIDPVTPPSPKLTPWGSPG